MAEILTESFCERCGTRYTFELPRPRRLGVGRIRTLTRGMRNFVANDSSSFADAMAAARDDESRSASQRQLDAFRETFNFCMGCRQYTCRNCWNERASQCLSCAPDLSLEVLPGAVPELAPVGIAEPADRNGEEPAWPTADLRRFDTAVAPAAELVAPIGAPVFETPAEGSAATEPAALEPAALEPAALEPAALEPAAIEPEALEPAAIEPEELGPEEAEPAAIAPEAAAAAVPTEPVLSAVPTEPVLTAVPTEPVLSAVPTEPVLTAVPTDIELTAEELAAIQGALARHVPAPAAAPSVEAPPETGPSGVEADAQTRRPGEPPQAATATPRPSEPVATARAATRHLLRRFRPQSDRAMPTANPLPAPSTAALPAVEEAASLPGGDAAAASFEARAAASANPADMAIPGPALATDELPQSSHVAAETPQPVLAAPGAPVESAPATPPEDHVAQPIWRIVAPESGSPAGPPPAPGRWIAPPAGNRRSADAVPSAPWAARVATARSLESPVWVASSNDILAAGSSGAAAPVSIQACVTCGLSLSANARFCRRCGSRQG